MDLKQVFDQNQIRLKERPISNKEFAIPKVATPSSGLTPYTGDFGYEEAAHLLKRTIFGASGKQIRLASLQGIGLDAVVDQLLAGQDMPPPPVNPDYLSDPTVGIGETWVNADFIDPDTTNGYRFRSLVGWTYSHMMETNIQEISITEKMTLFWHNHFVVRGLGDARFIYKYAETLRRNALGNFKTFVEEMVIDPAMLVFLNGNQNSRIAPNENFARELMELFTLGKGVPAGPGDYTTFTEHDVREIARALTGWRDYGYFFTINLPEKIGAYYTEFLHDDGEKRLSHRFNNATIGNDGEDEYKTVVDIIFRREEVASFICRKLYRWFVYYEISEEVEHNVIQPMAQIFRDNNYEIKPVLEALLKSEHFFDESLRGAMIKSPLDFTIGLFSQFNIPIKTLSLADEYGYWVTLYNFTTIIQQQYYNHPTVAGWKAYYQEPSYYQIWINSVTLPFRMAITDVMAYVGLEMNGERIIINALEHLEQVSDPYDINTVIQDTARLIYSREITDEQHLFLKSVVIGGLPDFEWTVEYSHYKENPIDDNARNSIELKIRLLLVFMMRMPEYYLM